MYWMPQQLFPTITGLDIILWIAAYATWRYLTGMTRVRAARVSCGVHASSAARDFARRPLTGRWAVRATALDKMQLTPPRRVAEHRRLRRAA